MGRKRKSMFSELKDEIIRQLNEGKQIKEIYESIDHGTGMYEYISLYRYIHVTLGYRRDKADCEHCENLIWVYSPTTQKQKPVCLFKKRIMRTDFKDKPYVCQQYRKGEIIREKGISG